MEKNILTKAAAEDADRGGDRAQHVELAAEHDDGAVVLVVILVAAEAREAPALPPHDDNAATLALVIKGDAALFFAFVVSAHYLFPRQFGPAMRSIRSTKK